MSSLGSTKGSTGALALCAALLAFGIAGCNPVLVREFQVSPDQVGKTPIDDRAQSVLAPYQMLPFSPGSSADFGFRRQWPNLSTGRPGEMSVTFKLASSGDAWLVRLREWPVAHQTAFGANVESSLFAELKRDGYEIVPLQ
jgi:hypothetical protein